MRHRVYGKKLGLNKNGRTSLFRKLVRALILSEKLETTESKSKAIKGLVDKIINQAKSPTARYLVSQFLTDKKVAKKLIKDIVPRLSDRNSGYTSVVKMGRRLGDNSMMVRMSLLLSETKTVSEKPKRGEKETGKKVKQVEVVLDDLAKKAKLKSKVRTKSVQEKK